jgi:hypothetical protein
MAVYIKKNPVAGLALFYGMSQLTHGKQIT